MTDKTPSKKPLIIGGGVLVGLIALLLVPWLMRNTIATSMARDQMAERGLSCDERFRVTLSGGFGTATIGPTRCTREGGIIEAVELTGDMTVELSGTTPESVELESVRLVLRDSDVRGGGDWADVLRRLNLEQKLAGLLKGVSELASMDLPETTVVQGEVYRGTRAIARARALHIEDAGERYDLSGESIVFGGDNMARLDLNDVTGTATPSTVHLEGDATARAAVALFGLLQRSSAFELDATGLDSASPEFDLRGDF